MASRPLPPIDRPAVPVAFEVEMAALGIALSSPAGLSALRGILHAEMFADDRHGRIWSAVCAMQDSGQPANTLGLKVWADRTGVLDDLGGWPYLAKLAGSTVTAQQWLAYGTQVADLYRRRRLMAAGQTLSDEAARADPDLGVADILARHDASVQAIFDGSAESAAQPLSHAIAAALASADAASRGENRGTMTGYDAIDRIIGTLPRDGLVILGARPGMGKTALAMGVAENVARRGKHVLIHSLEMSAEELARRLLAGVSGVPLSAIKRGPKPDDFIGGDHWTRLLNAQREVDTLPITIDERPALQYAQIRARAAAMARTGKLGLIIVDHLGLVGVPQDIAKHGPTAKIGFVSNGLKRLAKECHAPVLALCQLSRAVESRDDKRPTLADLRQSGEIEQDADIVMFVYREHYYAKGNYPQQGDETDERFAQRLEEWKLEIAHLEPRAEAIVAKQRDGESAVARLEWHAATTRFTDREGR